MARRIVARRNLKKNDQLNFSNLKPVITKNKKAILANRIYLLIGKKIKKNLKQVDPINKLVLKR